MTVTASGADAAGAPMRVVCVAGRGGGIPRAQAARFAERLASVPGVSVEVVPAEWEPEPGQPVDCLFVGVGYQRLRDLPGEVAWVQLYGTGVDTVPPELLDGPWTLTCARGASAVPIAEFVLATMLAFEKQLPDVWIAAPPEAWYSADLGGLAGKRLAVLGMGSIGAAVARLGLAFSMSVVGLRATPRPADDGVEMAKDPIELVTGADHLVVAAPATTATHHIVGKELLEHVRPGAHVVNIARGSLVDHEALRTALDDGRVARASLDVTDPEPLPAGHWLYAHPRVRLSPHISWSANGADDRLLDICLGNVVARLRGEPLHGVVDRAAGY